MPSRFWSKFFSLLRFVPYLTHFFSQSDSFIKFNGVRLVGVLFMHAFHSLSTFCWALIFFYVICLNHTQANFSPVFLVLEKCGCGTLVTTFRGESTASLMYLHSLRMRKALCIQNSLILSTVIYCIINHKVTT